MVPKTVWLQIVTTIHIFGPKYEKNSALAECLAATSDKICGINLTHLRHTGQILELRRYNQVAFLAKYTL